MGKSHNKKRNVGIIYEQLLRKISASLIEGDEKTANIALSILKKHFKQGSQLYREFRLFQALVKTTVPSESLATRILQEAKSAAKNFNLHELEKEKSQLIKEINHALNDNRFYHQHVANYRSFATIQTLLNDWRRDQSGDFSRITSYEKKVHQWLLAEKKGPASSQQVDTDINNLTVRVMTEKFNQKYGITLNDEQSSLIKEYVFSQATEKTAGLVTFLEQIKAVTLTELRDFAAGCQNKILNEKMDHVRRNVVDLSTENIDDDTISRFLLICKLKQELLENDNER